MRISSKTFGALPFAVLLTTLSACSGESTPTTTTLEPIVVATDATVADPIDTSIQREFADYSESLMRRMLERNPEWSLYSGLYDNAHQVTLPDETRRTEDLLFIDAELARLSQFEPSNLPPELRIDHNLLSNRLQSMRWYLTVFNEWQWNPASYNAAGPIGLILNTPYAPEEDRLRTVMARLEQVPAFYQAARANINNPTAEHTELAVTQNRGTLNLLGSSLQDRVAASQLESAEKDRFEQARQDAVNTIEGFITELQTITSELSQNDSGRDFRIGAEIYESKFAFDIQSGFTARDMYERAVAEKNRLHDDMDAITINLWPSYFPDVEMPEDRLTRIGQLIDHLSNQHIARDQFISEIERQIPLLAAFVAENDLLEQDPSRPLVVRETPEYMRGSGAGASVSAPGPFNPTADTYYNVTPLDDYNDEQAASYLREYNQWVLQILNIHEAIPG
ncbi:MAG: DUF885 family protein, partial [Pseudohongiella sp.]|nr:DUF885 family protein [Pseudohongiella sp.]